MSPHITVNVNISLTLKIRITVTVSNTTNFGSFLVKAPPDHTPEAG